MSIPRSPRPPLPSPEADELSAADREALIALADELRRRGLPPAFIEAGVRATARTLRMLPQGPAHPATARDRAEVQQFLAANPATDSPLDSPRREQRQLEAERLHNYALGLLREARLARSRHEIRKTRSRLRQIDRRRLVRLLRGEGVELCRRINACLGGD